MQKIAEYTLISLVPCPFRRLICCDAQRKSYGVFLPQQRMERIAIEGVPAARKGSLENRPHGGEAQGVSSTGRPLSKFMRHPRAHTEDPGRTRAHHDQIIRCGAFS